MALRSLRCVRFSSRFLKINNHEQSLRYTAEMEQPHLSMDHRTNEIVLGLESWAFGQIFGIENISYAIIQIN